MPEPGGRGPTGRPCSRRPIARPVSATYSSSRSTTSSGRTRDRRRSSTTWCAGPRPTVIRWRSSLAVGGLLPWRARHILGATARRWLDTGDARTTGSSLDGGARRAANPELDPRAAAAVADRSGGSPFWCELLAGAQNVDADVARIVADRLPTAGTDAAVLMDTIAVLGRQAPVEDLIAIRGWPEDRLTAARVELTARGLVVEEEARSESSTTS